MVIFMARSLALHMRPSARLASASHSTVRRACSVARAAAATPSSGAVTGMERANFLRNIMEEDLKSGKHSSIVTRFPPEPNGYLHIGHAKSICVNFGLGETFDGETYMRFDDTNPEKEEQEYVDAIKQDVQWLGFDWKRPERLTHASDYFDRFYELAVVLIREGKAYVESLSAEEMREYRGSLTSPGRNSPYRERTVEENLDLFGKMAAGEVADGEMVLRLKIDMASPNINMRDPACYRVKRNAEHPMTGTKWKVYPMYDFAHVLTDALEGITHSLCTLGEPSPTPACVADGLDLLLTSSESCRCRPCRPLPGHGGSRRHCCGSPRLAVSPCEHLPVNRVPRPPAAL